MIPPPAQRLMAKRAGATVVEVSGSHAVYVSQPDAVVALIAKADDLLACVHGRGSFAVAAHSPNTEPWTITK
jgi:hypothetical protein